MVLQGPIFIYLAKYTCAVYIIQLVDSMESNQPLPNPTTQDNTMTTATTTRSIDFSHKASRRVVYAANLAKVALNDRTEEVGHYDRFVYCTTLGNWEKVATILTAARSVAVGSEKAVLTAAISRIPTAAARAEAAARRATRRAEHRAARNA